MARICCNRCRTTFAPTQEEITCGMSFCPACGDGIQLRHTSESRPNSLRPEAQASIFSTDTKLFTEQDVEDVFLMKQVNRIWHSEEFMTFEQAIWEWADANAAPDYDYPTGVKQLMEAAKERYRRAQSLVKVAELICRDEEDRHKDSDPSGDAPVVRIQLGRESYYATLKAKDIPFEQIAEMYGYASMRLLVTIQQGSLPARRSQGAFLVTVGDIEQCIARGVLEAPASSTFAGNVMGVSYHIIARPWGAKLHLLVNSASEATPLVLAWVYAGKDSVSFGEDMSHAVLTKQRQEVHKRVDEWANKTIAEYRAKSRSHRADGFRDGVRMDRYGFYVDEDGWAWAPGNDGWMEPGEAEAERRIMDAEDGILWDD